MVVSRNLHVNLSSGLDVDREMLLTLFQVILDEMKVTYGIVHSFEVKLLPYSWTVYYTTEEETDRKFQEKINSVFKPGLFIFGEP